MSPGTKPTKECPSGSESKYRTDPPIGFPSSTKGKEVFYREKPPSALVITNSSKQIKRAGITPQSKSKDEIGNQSNYSKTPATAYRRSSSPKKSKLEDHYSNVKTTSIKSYTTATSQKFSISSHFSLGSRTSTIGPVGVLVARVTGRNFDNEQSPKSLAERNWFQQSIDDFIDSDCQRYKYSLVEGNPLKFSISILFSVIFVIMFIASLLVRDSNGVNGFASVNVNPLLGPSLEVLYKVGGNVGVWLSKALQTEWWRLIVANFVHAGIVHLLINTGALLVIAPKIDRWFGNVRSFLILLTSAIGAQIANGVVRSSTTVTVGSSGAICGILGAILADNLKNWKRLNHPGIQFFYWGFQVLVFLAIGFIPLIDNIAHVGGLITGFAVGMLIVPNHRIVATTPTQIALMKRRKRVRCGDVVSILLSLIALVAILGGGLFTIQNGISIRSPELCHAFLSLQC